MNRDVAIALLILLLAAQAVVLFVVSSVNPTTLAGQRVAGITLAIDMFLLAGFIMLYHNSFSKPVYGPEEEEQQTEEEE